jgi:hypothetical protein
MKALLKTTLLFLALHISFTFSAHEGMWIPALLESLNSDHLQASGLRLSAADIYSVNQSSLKDAIAHFGGGCTSEVISDQGLLLTNYHCGYGQIQSHSSVEDDYLTDGFWAMSKKEELSNPGLSATFIVRIDDVTDAVLKGVRDDMERSARNKQIYENIERLQAEATEGTDHEARIRPFFYGNEYYMIVTRTYKDVRLVGAPPSSIGKFGGDTDNWIWPRHTGDFALFRIYADKNNEPADYSEDNVPYRPKKHLEISMDGVDEGDFTMVYGFPGRTEQYLISDAVDQVMNIRNPLKIAMRETSLGIIDAAMAADDATRIKYAAKQSRISNAWKKWIGQNFGLKRNRAVEKKRGEEEAFQSWAESNAERSSSYASLLDDLKQANEQLAPYQLARELFIEYVFYGPEIFRFANRFDRLVNDHSQMKEDGVLDKEIEGLKRQIEAHFKDYDKAVDEDVFTALTPMLLDALPADIRPAFFKTTYRNKYAGSADVLASRLYSKKSLMQDKQALLDLAEGFDEKSAAKIKKDETFQLMLELYRFYFDEVRPSMSQRSERMDELMGEYVRAQQEMSPTEVFWPDANSTLRLTYGKIEGSNPRDAVEYKYYTTLDGVVAKYQPGHKDFDLPERLLDLHEKKDYGPYADEDGSLFVCFTGSNHTSGGNSGSPALDANGRLVGLNFDRSWESTMSDIMFDPSLCRNIMVDIRYVLFIVDKFAGAGHLVNEMDLVDLSRGENRIPSE